MAYMVIAVNEYTLEATEEKLHAARSSFHELLKQQPGFESYIVIKAGDSSAVALFTWESAEALAQIQDNESFRARFDEIWGSLTASSEAHTGEVVYSTDLAT